MREGLSCTEGLRCAVLLVCQEPAAGGWAAALPADSAAAGELAVPTPCLFPCCSEREDRCCSAGPGGAAARDLPQRRPQGMDGCRARGPRRAPGNPHPCAQLMARGGRPSLPLPQKLPRALGPPEGRLPGLSAGCPDPRRRPGSGLLEQPPLTQLVHAGPSRQPS